MVQGHTFYELLAPAVQAEAWYRWHERLHGLTAPMFLFASGLAFGVTTLDAFSAHARFGRPFAGRMRRYALLIVVGYALQLPGQSLIAPLAAGTLLTPPVLRIGPLQAIGVVLGACQLLVALCRRPGVFLACTALLFALVLCGAPWVWQSKLSDAVPLPLAMWLDASRGSHFPLFPWASFVLAGVLTAGAVRGAAVEQAPLVALALSALGGALALLALQLWYGGHGPAAWAAWATSPFLVLARLGYVLLALAGWCALERVLGARRAWADALARLSRRSLFVYAAHLLILYGTPFTPNLARRVGATLELGHALLASAAVLGLTIAAARAWDVLAAPEHAATRRRAQLSLAAVALYCFVARDALRLIQVGFVNP